MRRTLCTALLLGLTLAATPALSHPGMGTSPMAGMESAFRKADADGDGGLSREEFLKAWPSLKEGAFSVIDADGSGAITLQEWQTFSLDHGRGMTSGPKGPGAMPPVTPESPKGLPMVMPPGSR